MPQDIPKDPWGHDYVYKFPGEHGDEPDIVCLGADGQPGGEGLNADIVSWKNRSRTLRGVTCIEMMVVVAIVGLIVAVIGARRFGRPGQRADGVGHRFRRELSERARSIARSGASRPIEVDHLAQGEPARACIRTSRASRAS